MYLGRALLGGIAAVALAGSPALAGKRDDTLKAASGIIPESFDAYMNNVREGVVIGHHVWSNLIYRNPKTNKYEGELATSGAVAEGP